MAAAQPAIQISHMRILNPKSKRGLLQIQFARQSYRPYLCLCSVFRWWPTCVARLEMPATPITTTHDRLIPPPSPGFFVASDRPPLPRRAPGTGRPPLGQPGRPPVRPPPTGTSASSRPASPGPTPNPAPRSPSTDSGANSSATRRERAGQDPFRNPAGHPCGPGVVRPRRPRPGVRHE